VGPVAFDDEFPAVGAADIEDLAGVGDGGFVGVVFVVHPKVEGACDIARASGVVNNEVLTADGGLLRELGMGFEKY
jgi:hypothetical protein